MSMHFGELRKLRRVAQIRNRVFGEFNKSGGLDMFWGKFVRICNERGISPTAVVEALHISRGSITKWKNGSKPNDTTILKLADYFEVSPGYFFEPGTETASSDELSEYLEELKSRPEMRMLFSLAKGATKEDVEQAVAIIEALRKSKNG